MVDTTGSVFSVIGTIITFGAYFSGQRKLRLRELAPRLTALAQWVRIRFRRLIGRPGKNVTVNVPPIVATATMSASARVWAPIAAGDTTETRVEKIARNLDTLVTDMDEFRRATDHRIGAAERDTFARITQIEADIAARGAVERAAETAAARWEINGLLLVLLGTILNLIG